MHALFRLRKQQFVSVLQLTIKYLQGRIQENAMVVLILLINSNIYM